MVGRAIYYLSLGRKVQISVKQKQKQKNISNFKILENRCIFIGYYIEFTTVRLYFLRVVFFIVILNNNINVSCFKMFIEKRIQRKCMETG